MTMLKLLKYIILIISFACALNLSSCSTSAGKTIQSEAYLTFLNAALKLDAGEHQEAYTLLKKAHILQPDSITIIQELALVSLKLEKPKEAKDWIQKAILLKPDSISARTILARIYIQENNITQAAETLEPYVQDKPEHEDALLLLGSIYAHQKKFKKASDFFLRAAKLKGEKAFLAYYNLGLSREKLKDYKQAEKAFKKSTELNPSFLPAYTAISDIFVEQGNIKGAVKQYKKLIKAQPDNIKAREMLVRLLLNMDKVDEAMDELRSLRPLLNDDIRISLQLAVLLIDQKKYKEALDMLNEIDTDHKDPLVIFYKSVVLEYLERLKDALSILQTIKAEKMQVQVQLRTAYLYKKMGDQNKAIKSLEDALKKDPKNVTIILSLVELYDQAGKNQESEKLIRASLKEFPSNKQLLFYLIMALDKQGEKTEAKKTARDIISKDPDNAPALNYLGYTYADEGIHLEEAEEMIKKAVSLQPEDGYITDSLGWVYYKKKEYDKAIFYLEKAMELVKDDPIIAEHLADAYLAASRKKDALRIYKATLGFLKNNAKNKGRIQEKIDKIESDKELKNLKD